jgi:serine/threonine protein kinase
MEIKIAGKYKIVRKIGQGSFGQIYLGNNIQTNEEVAIKLEENRRDSNLQYESRIYRVLQESPYIPKLYWYGLEYEYNIMVIELLGPSLDTLLTYCKSPFSLKTVLILADQILFCIEFMHSYNYIHRDIKPENFLIGIGKKASIVHMIDFGLSKKYTEKSGHIPYKDGNKITGTARYVSFNTHNGLEQSRRDDLESIGYMLIYLTKGRLPWQGLPGSTKQQKYMNIKQKKLSTSLNELCEGLPNEFSIYIQYCRNLRFEEKPDYSFLRRIFKELFNRENFVNDSIYDWCRSSNRD